VPTRASTIELAAQVRRGDAWAAFLICRRHSVLTISDAVARIAPRGAISGLAFDALADGFDLWRRAADDQRLRDELERDAAHSKGVRPE
jgi:hypothetical protein